MKLFSIILAIVLFVNCPVIVLSSFDYLKLAVQWPPAFCSKHQFGRCDKSKVFEEFNIHGLWPSNFSNPQPESCLTIPLDLGKLKGILKDLTSSWKSLLQGRLDNIFWDYQWRKHGTCFTRDEKAYFSLAIKLYKQYASWLYPDLKNKGIVPDKTKTYSLQKLKDELKSTLHGAIPEVVCKGNQSHPNLLDQVLEIRICFSRDGKAIWSCPPVPPPQGACLSDVKLLPSSAVTVWSKQSRRSREGLSRKIIV